MTDLFMFFVRRTGFQLRIPENKNNSPVRKLSKHNGSQHDPEEKVCGQSLIELFVVTHQVPLQGHRQIKTTPEILFGLLFQKSHFNLS